jgi:hypothetical protein
MSEVPEGAQLSDDGFYWWDGTDWQLVDQTGADQQAGNEAPTDFSSEQALADQVDQNEAQSLAAAVAAGNDISSGFGSDTLMLEVSDPSQMSGEDVRSQCGSKCDLSEAVDGEVFALVGCGDGTCPSCPAGLGNLIVKHWCAYVGVSSHRSAIVLHLLFGAKLGPFLV